MDEIIGQVSPAEYWEFMCTIEQMQKSQLVKKVAELELLVHERNITVAELKRRNYKDILSKSLSDMADCEVEYKRVKAKIEESIGMSLDACAIDPVTFEIKKLADEPKKQESVVAQKS